MTKVLIRRKDRIDYVINGLCSYWGVEPSEFRRNCGKSKERKLRKQIAIFILYEIADLGYKDICGALGYKDGNVHTLWEWKREITDTLYGDAYINRKIRQEYFKILNYLNL